VGRVILAVCPNPQPKRAIILRVSPCSIPTTSNPQQGVNAIGGKTADGLDELIMTMTRFSGRVPVGPVASGDDSPDRAGPAVAGRYDADGDVDVDRCKFVKIIVRIPHAMATLIPDVGLQVWAGSLLLADFAVSNSDAWRGKTILELGAGTGLVSIVAARTAGTTVICTDGFDNVLQNCAEAVKLNDSGSNITTRSLDWSAFGRRGGSVLRQCLRQSPASASPFAWAATDIDSFEDSCSVMLAADVVYVDQWTVAFADCVFALLGGPVDLDRVLFLTIEKRINFSLDRLADVAPAYECFAAEIIDNCRFSATRMKVDFPQVFSNYTRSAYLELWKITRA